MEDDVEQINQRAESIIDTLEEQFMDLAEAVQDYAIAQEGVNIKDIDEAYRKLKATSRELNSLAKQKRKALTEKEEG